MRLNRTLLIGLASMVVVAGCATTGGDQMANTVTATYRTVAKLDKDLGGSVERLNETAADLGERVNESNAQARRVESLAEENQQKLEELEQKLDSLTLAIYKYLGITPPSNATSGWGGSTGAGADIQVDNAQVEPPASAGESVTGMAEEPSPLEDVEGTAEPTAAVADGGSGPLADYNRAMETYRKGDYETALSQFSGYMQNFPKSEVANNAQFWKAECQFKLNRFEEAITEFQALVANYPDSEKVPYAMYNQAAAHLKLGQQARAMAMLKELVENYPMTPAAARARSKLKEVEGN